MEVLTYNTDPDPAGFWVLGRRAFAFSPLGLGELLGLLALSIVEC